MGYIGGWIEDTQAQHNFPFTMGTVYINLVYTYTSYMPILWWCFGSCFYKHDKHYYSPQVRAMCTKTLSTTHGHAHMICWRVCIEDDYMLLYGNDKKYTMCGDQYIKSIYTSAALE